MPPPPPVQTCLHFFSTFTACRFQSDLVKNRDLAFSATNKDTQKNASFLTGKYTSRDAIPVRQHPQKGRTGVHVGVCILHMKPSNRYTRRTYHDLHHLARLDLSLPSSDVVQDLQVNCTGSNPIKLSYSRSCRVYGSRPATRSKSCRPGMRLPLNDQEHQQG